MTSISDRGGPTIKWENLDNLPPQDVASAFAKKVNDTTSTAPPVNPKPSVYANPSGKVSLPPPQTNLSPGQMAAQFPNLKPLASTFQSLSSTVLPELLQAGDLKNQPDINFMKQAGQAINQMSDKELLYLASKPSDTPADVKSQLLYNLFHEDANIPDNQKQYLTQLTQTTESSVQAQFGPVSPSLLKSIPAALQDGSATLTFNAKVANLLNQSGLSASTIQQLTFALKNPSAIANLPPDLQKLLADVKSQALTLTKEALGLPDDWPMPEGIGEPAGLGETFDRSFEAEVNKMVANGQMTQTKATLLVALHYNPVSQVPGAEDLKPLLGHLESQVLSTLQSKWGFPTGYRPTTDSAGYEQVANSSFPYLFEQNMNSFQPPLTSDQKALLREAASNPAVAANLPPELRAALAAIQSKTVGQIQAQYGFPSSWMPTIGEIQDPSTFQNSSMNQFLDQAKEQVGIAGSLVNAMPAGPAQLSYKDYLKIVSDALEKLSVVLYQVQTADANMSKTLTRMNLDLELNKIAKQRKEMEDVEKKEKKMAWLSPIMKIVNVVMLVIGVLLLGPIGLGLAINALSEGQKFEDINLVKELFSSAVKLLGPNLGPILLGIAGALAVALASAGLIASVVMMVGCPLLAIPLLVASLAVLVCIGGEMALDTMMGGGVGLGDILEAMGITGTAEMVIKMIISTAFSLVVGIVITVAVLIILAVVIAIAVIAIVFLFWTFVADIVAVAAIMAAIGSVLTTIGTAIGGFVAGCGTMAVSALGTAAEVATSIGLEMVATVLEMLAQMLAILFGNIAEMITDFFASLAANFAELTIQQVVQKAIEFVTGVIETSLKVGFEVAQSVVKIQNEVIQAEIAMIKGEFDAYAVVVEQLIKQLKSLITSLESDIGSNMSWISNINQVLTHNYGQLTQALTKLAQAG